MLERKKGCNKSRITGRIVVIIILGVLAAVLIAYAHFYVSVHHLPSLTEDEALKLVSFQYNGSYTFFGSGARWLAVWRITQPTPSANFAYVYLFKTEQNISLFVQSTDLIILRLASSNTTDSNFHAEINEVIPQTNYIVIKIEYEFGKKGTYHVNLSLHVKVYEKTLLGYLPKEEIQIPIEATVNYGP